MIFCGRSLRMMVSMPSSHNESEDIKKSVFSGFDSIASAKKIAAVKNDMIMSMARV